MRAIFEEQWFGPESCLALGNLYRTTHGVKGAVLEVGCWEGRSTCALANAAHPEIVHAVDTWNGSPNEVSYELAASRDVYAAFVHNVRVLTHGNVEPHRVGWREFFKTFTDPIRFVHIDAEHSYQEVAENIEAVLPLMRPGGIICGDDVHHEPVRQAVLDTLGDANVVATLWYWQAP